MYKLMLPILLGGLAHAGTFETINRYGTPPETERADPVRQAWSDHDHGIALATFEEWVRLSHEDCRPRETPSAVGVAVAVSRVDDPEVPETFDTVGDMRLMAQLYEQNGVSEIVKLEEPTKAQIEAAMTKALTDTRCGDRVYLSYAGIGVQTEGWHGETTAILGRDSTRACAVAGPGCAAPTALTSADLVAFVTLARNRGVTPILFMDSCHGTDVGARGASSVWTHAADATSPLTLRTNAADFAAFFAADATSYAMQLEGADVGGGAFTFGLAQTLSALDMPTPRTVADGVTTFLASAAPYQRPLIQASDPDLPLFGDLRPRTRGGSQLAAGAEIRLRARGLRTDERGAQWLPVSSRGTTMRGEVSPTRGLKLVRSGSAVVPVDTRGHFTIDVPALTSDRAELWVAAVYEDFTLRTERVELVQPGLDVEQLIGGEQYALLIGVQDYESDEIADLETPLGDVAAIRDLLTSAFGFRTTLVEPGGIEHDLVLENATHHQILRALEVLAMNTQPDDRVLIYYAGHSEIPQNLDEAYWMPADANPRSVFGGWISADQIRAAIKIMPAKSVLVVSDSCYSGKLTRSSRVLDAPKRPTAENLARLLASRSRLLISSGHEEPVLDGGGSGHSVFAEALLTALGGRSESAFTSLDVFGEIRERKLPG